MSSGTPAPFLIATSTASACSRSGKWCLAWQAPMGPPAPQIARRMAGSLRAGSVEDAPSPFRTSSSR